MKISFFKKWNYHPYNLFALFHHDSLFSIKIFLWMQKKIPIYSMSTAALWVCTQQKKKMKKTMMMKAQKSAFVKSSEMRIMTGLIRWCLYTTERETKQLNGKKWKEEDFWTFWKLWICFANMERPIFVVCVRKTTKKGCWLHYGAW